MNQSSGGPAKGLGSAISPIFVWLPKVRLHENVVSPLIVFAFCVFCGGCSTTSDFDPTFSGPAGLLKEAFADNVRECNILAKEKYPSKTSWISTGKVRYEPGETRCETYRNETKCTSTPGTMVEQSMQHDDNYRLRKQEFDSCMGSRGYRKN